MIFFIFWMFLIQTVEWIKETFEMKYCKSYVRRNDYEERYESLFSLFLMASSGNGKILLKRNQWINTLFIFIYNYWKSCRFGRITNFRKYFTAFSISQNVNQTKWLGGWRSGKLIHVTITCYRLNIILPFILASSLKK